MHKFKKIGLGLILVNSIGLILSLLFRLDKPKKIVTENFENMKKYLAKDFEGCDYFLEGKRKWCLDFEEYSKKDLEELFQKFKISFIDTKGKLAIDSNIGSFSLSTDCFPTNNHNSFYIKYKIKNPDLAELDNAKVNMQDSKILINFQEENLQEAIVKVPKEESCSSIMLKFKKIEEGSNPITFYEAGSKAIDEGSFGNISSSISQNLYSLNSDILKTALLIGLSSYALYKIFKSKKVYDMIESGKIDDSLYEKLNDYVFYSGIKNFGSYIKKYLKKIIRKK